MFKSLFITVSYNRFFVKPLTGAFNKKKALEGTVRIMLNITNHVNVKIGEPYLTNTCEGQSAK